MPKRLSLQDFVDFGNAVSQTLVLPYQDLLATAKDSPPTQKRPDSSGTIADQGDTASRADKLKACGTGKARAVWECLFTAYMTAYYQGNFVDRNGSKYSKPKLGLTISNETITSTVAIFLEAFFDIAVMDADGVKAPIIYTVDATDPKAKKAVWVTSGKNQPTLVDAVVALGLAAPPDTPLPNIIEVATAQTMDATRLCVARLLGGAAGDAAQPLTGIVVRATGGANLGFTFGLDALGKFSFGDNDTLTKLIDTVVENFPRRLTETAIEHYLYGKPIDQAPTPQILQDTLRVASWVGSCK